MKLFYDNIETVEEFLGSGLTKVEETEEYNSIICEKIFDGKPYYKSLSDFSDYWKYLFIEKHSNSSQFDKICNLVSENNNLPSNFIAIAETGAGFHGFRNRRWETKKGNLHLTLFFKPASNVENIHMGILLLAAVSVIKTIDAVPSLGKRAQTKWVNDIVLGNSKVCGIITKSFSTGNNVTGAVIGLGLNVLSTPKIVPDLFTTKTTSILNEAENAEIKLPSILKNLLTNLSSSIELLDKGNYEELLKTYINRSCVIGSRVAIYDDLPNGNNELIAEGIVKNINEKLELILENQIGPIRKGRLALIV